MIPILVDGPAVEPVDLAAMRAHLRVWKKSANRGKGFLRRKTFVSLGFQKLILFLGVPGCFRPFPPLSAWAVGTAVGKHG